MLSLESQRVSQNITNHLMTGPLGHSELFPSNLNVSLHFVSETLRFSGNKIHCSPRDSSLKSDLLPDRATFRFCQVTTNRSANKSAG